jgi:DNA-binding beta-propeller fold protein YncE
MRLLGYIFTLLTIMPAAATELTYRPVPDFLRVPAEWKLEQVSAVALDAQGAVFVFNRGPHPVAVFDKEGKFQRSFGEGQGKSPHGLRFDNEGNIWTTDWKDHAVRKFSPEGKLLLTLGEPGKPGNDGAHFNQPTDIVFATNGDFFISDGYGNSRVAKFDRQAKFLFAWGKKGKGEGEFNLPHAVRMDSRGLVYVGDRENNRIQVFDVDGKFQRQFPGMAPFGLFITPEDRLYIADGRGNKVIVMDTQGKRLAEWGVLGSEPGNFMMPHGITVGPDGAVYVAEINGKRLQKFVRK